MRIGVDICDLSTGIVGVGSVILNMIKMLEKKDPVNRYFLYQNDLEDYCTEKNFTKRISKLGLYAYKSEQIYFSARCVLDSLDIFHAPIHMPPFYVPRKTKIVLTVHDLHSEMDSNLYPPAMNRYFIPHRRNAIERADAIIVHSNFVKEKIIELCAVSPDKIHLIKPGIKKEFSSSLNFDTKKDITKKYNLPDRFILFVGSVEPWKRVPFLIKAVEQYRYETGDTISLVVVGRHGWKKEDCAFLERYVAQNEWVRWYGYVDQEDLPSFFQLSRLFCSASLWEGVGLIFLEAMAAGVPIVAAEASAITETVGSAGVLFSPHSKELFVQSIKAVLENETKHSILSARGREQIQYYSWDRYGEQILDLYASIHSH